MHLRGLIPREEFDYQTLISGLRGYTSPRDKITDLLRTGLVVRLKKGFYVFGPAFRRGPVSREVIANLLYGPSYISLEYALQYHGLIPEAVETVTSITTGRSRLFRTALGTFTYRKIPLKAFRIGVDLVEAAERSSFLIATKEKALSDKIVAERHLIARRPADMREYLVDGLRVPPHEIALLDLDAVTRISSEYGSRRLHVLTELVREAKQRQGGER